MFGSKYSRLKFWVISICLLIPTVIINVFAKAFESNGDDVNALIAYSLITIIGLIWINTLANRVRDYRSNPWISLWALIPLVNILLAFVYGFKQYKTKESLEDSTSNENMENKI